VRFSLAAIAAVYQELCMLAVSQLRNVAQSEQSLCSIYVCMKIKRESKYILQILSKLLSTQ